MSNKSNGKASKPVKSHNRTTSGRPTKPVKPTAGESSLYEELLGWLGRPTKPVKPTAGEPSWNDDPYSDHPGWDSAEWRAKNELRRCRELAYEMFEQLSDDVPLATQCTPGAALHMLDGIEEFMEAGDTAQAVELALVFAEVYAHVVCWECTRKCLFEQIWAAKVRREAAQHAAAQREPRLNDEQTRAGCEIWADAKRAGLTDGEAARKTIKLLKVYHGLTKDISVKQLKRIVKRDTT